MLKFEFYLQNFECNNDVILTFGQQKLTLEIKPCDFLKIFLSFWLFEPHFLINFFLIRKAYIDYISIRNEQLVLILKST